MTKTYMRYVRNKHGNGIGAVAITFENGIFGIGTAMCHPTDRFDKTEGRNLAMTRSKNAVSDNGMEITDILNGFWIAEILDILPKSAKRRDDVDHMLSAIMDMIEQDILVDFARMYARSFVK